MGVRLLARFSGVASRLLPGTLHHRLNALRGIDQPSLVALPPGCRVAVLAPHPDDELLGCGATLAKHLEAGHQVCVVFVSSGEASAAVTGSTADRVSQREQEATRAAAGAIPSATLRFLRLPDGKLPSCLDEMVTLIAGILAEFAIDLVYAPHPGEPHTDHAAVARALVRVLAPFDAHPLIANVAWYEVWSPLPATHVVDVTAQLAAKLAGLACYSSQLAMVDYGRVAEGLAAYRSSHAMHGKGFAEAFAVVDRAQLRSLASDPELRW